MVPGSIVVLPEGVDRPPDDYQGALGIRPLALVRIGGTIVGEVYNSPLKKSSTEEAKGMAASIGPGKPIRLLARTTRRDGDETVEVVTLQFDLDSKFGNPWVLHSVYFPRQEASITFKLVASEARFKEVLPYFEAMFVKGGATRSK
jgi:hypothetical protein